jgi:RNA polymerase sigma-70 factor (ECF subfamily)
MIDHVEALRACAGGDRLALRALFDAEAGRLLGVALRILKRRDLAEEAVQDAFIQVWRHASQYDPVRGAARSWLNAIVRNRALTILREVAREDVVPHEPGAGVQELDLLESAVDRLDVNTRLKDCLQALDETKRRSVLMAYMFGYTHGEIAGRLNVPLGTAKAWVRRGLQALRECLA